MIQTTVLRSRITVHILILILCGFLTIIPAAWAIRALTSRTWSSAFDGAWALVASTLLIVYFGRFAILKLHRNSLLLDIGPNPSQALGLLGSLMFFGGALLSGDLFALPQYVRTGDVLESLNALLSAILLPGFLLLLACSRLQLRQRGIWEYGNFIPWQRIRGYRWQNDDTLVLDTRFLGLEQKQAYDIPAEKISVLNHLLETRLGQQAQTL